METKYVWVKTSHRSGQLEFFNPAFSSIEAVNEDKMTYYEKAKEWADRVIQTYENSIEYNQNKLNTMSSGQRRVRQKIEHAKKSLKIFQEGLDNPITLIDRYLGQANFQYVKFDLV